MYALKKTRVVTLPFMYGVSEMITSITTVLDLHAKTHVCMLVHSARIVRQTEGHTHTHRHMMSKLLHLPLMRGVINWHQILFTENK